MTDQEKPAALDQHRVASDANDFETEHSLYHEDAVLEYPRSGERIRRRRHRQITGSLQPNDKHAVVQRIVSREDLDHRIHPEV